MGTRVYTPKMYGIDCSCPPPPLARACQKYLPSALPMVLPSISVTLPGPKMYGIEPPRASAMTES
jgi:hypothetical protein